MRIGCVLMAAGNASRFGGNKLAAQVAGKSLICRAMDAVPTEELADVVVVTRHAAFAALAEERAFRVVTNEYPQRGVSYTIRLGIEALGRVDAAMFMVADQPMLRRETVSALVRFFRRQGGQRIAALASQGQRGNPCVFPAKYFPELLALEGDRGGNAVIRRHEGELALLAAEAEELQDVDTLQALLTLEERALRAAEPCPSLTEYIK